MRRIAILGTILFCFTQTIKADTLGVQLSDESASFTYATEIFGGQYGPANFEAGGFFNEDDDMMFHLGLSVNNDSLDNPVNIGIGTRAYYADVGNATGQTQADAAAITIGIELLFIPDSFGGIGLGFHYYGAPGVTSFLDAEAFTDYGVKLDYELSEQTSVLVGYRKIEVELDNYVELEVNSSVYVGILRRF